MTVTRLRRIRVGCLCARPFRDAFSTSGITCGIGCDCLASSIVNHCILAVTLANTRLHFAPASQQLGQVGLHLFEVRGSRRLQRGAGHRRSRLAHQECGPGRGNRQIVPSCHWARCFPPHQQPEIPPSSRALAASPGEVASIARTRTLGTSPPPPASWTPLPRPDECGGSA